MNRHWTERELRTLKEAHDRKVCGLNPAWGRCQHACCAALWVVTPATATDQERRVVFGDLPAEGVL